MSTLKIANIQLNSQDDIDANLNIIQNAVSIATQNGAKLVVLPENACMMGSQHELAKRFDEIHRWYGTLANALNIHLLAGTLPCQTRPNEDADSVEQGKYRQSCLLFDNTGKQVARYDKIHLFRAQVNDGVGNYDESRTFEAGDRLVVAPCMIDGIAINIGMAVCFDVRFSAMFQRLRQMGADIICVPSAFTHATGQAHWQILLQARALDSQCLVIGSTQGGTHTFTHKEKVHARQTWGHAMMVDAHGQIIAQTQKTAVDDTGFIISYANFDKKGQENIRQTLPLIHCHRLA